MRILDVVNGERDTDQIGHSVLWGKLHSEGNFNFGCSSFYSLAYLHIYSLLCLHSLVLYCNFSDKPDLNEMYFVNLESFFY
jgi:hypothetical protein